MASHLFTAMITPFPLSWAIPAILASCSVTPSAASITINYHICPLYCCYGTDNAVTLQLFLDLVLSAKSCSIDKNIFLAVPCTISVSMASLVVPAISDTITRFSPRSLLIMEDFPTFGFPTMAIFGISDHPLPLPVSSGKCLITSSSISPSPSLDGSRNRQMDLRFPDYKIHKHPSCISQSCPPYLPQASPALPERRSISATLESESTKSLTHICDKNDHICRINGDLRLLSHLGQE